MSPRPRVRRRNLLVLLVAVVLVAVVTVVLLVQRDDGEEPPVARGCSGLPAPPATSGATPDRPFIGTLQTQPDKAGQESRSGIKMAMLELSWRAFEPSPGKFNDAYAALMCDKLARFRAAGMQVTLGLGMHYAPDWLLADPDNHFIDQSGNRSEQADFVFNPTVRAQANEYMTHVDEALGLRNFWAVRITSGGSSELFYPSGGYWAFSAGAQNKGPRPEGLAANPLPGWRPATGDTSPSVAQRGAWARWYVGALSNVADWQMDVLRGRGYDGYLQVLTPGQGLRPTQLPELARDALPMGLVARGAVWSWVYGGLRHRDDVTAYVSSVADGSGSNDTCRASDEDVALDSAEVNAWSATRWISRVAREFGLSVAGEISAYPTSDVGQRRYADASSSGTGATAYAQARTCGFLGLYWAHDEQVHDGTVTAAQVGGLAGPDPAVPPDASG